MKIEHSEILDKILKDYSLTIIESSNIDELLIGSTVIDVNLSNEYFIYGLLGDCFIVQTGLSGWIQEFKIIIYPLGNKLLVLVNKDCPDEYKVFPEMIKEVTDKLIKEISSILSKDSLFSSLYGINKVNRYESKTDSSNYICSKNSCTNITSSVGNNDVISTSSIISNLDNMDSYTLSRYLFKGNDGSTNNDSFRIN